MFNVMVNPSQYKKDQKNGVFFSAASRKKDIIFGAAGKSFSPYYFVTALAHAKKVNLDPVSTASLYQLPHTQRVKIWLPFASKYSILKLQKV